ncbi:MAG: cache domain-containing protein [Promethearchaeota archaeon]
MTTANKTQIKYGIRTKILIAFTAFSIIALIGVSGIILGFFGTMNVTTTNESEEALTTQIQANMITSAQENAHTIGEKLQSSVNDVKAMAFFASNLFNNPDDYGEYPSYSDSKEDHPELNLTFADGYGAQLVTFDYSMYHLAPDVYTTDYSDANATVQEMVNVSANLDHIFRYTKAANPDLGWIYMGFELGIFRCYPWVEFDTEYDPRARPWYDTVNLQDSTDVIITSPYVDANGLGLMITIAQGVFNETSGALIGIIAVDLTIDTIRDNILDISFLDDKGYAFLIDKNGLAVVHPDVVEPAEGEDVTTNIAEVESFTAAMITEITTQSSGVGIYEKTSAGDYYFAYSAIAGTDFILVNVVAEEDALASVAVLQEEVSKAIKNVQVTLIVIILLAGAASVFLGTTIAGQITKPVKVLTESIQKLTSQDSVRSILQSGEEIVIDEALEAQDDEIGDLTRAFKGMLSAIKEDSQKK